MKVRTQSAEKLPRRHYRPLGFDELSMSFVGSPFSGRVQVSLARAMALTLPPTRSVLLGLRRDFHISRPSLAAFLGVGESTLKSWETGKRSPSHAAQRCVLFLDNLLRENRITDLMELVTWKRCPAD